jgi:hypothetical protein
MLDNASYTGRRDEYAAKVRAVEEAEKQKTNMENQRDSGGAPDIAGTGGQTPGSVGVDMSAPIVVPGVSIPIKLPTCSRKQYLVPLINWTQKQDVTKHQDFVLLDTKRFDFSTTRCHGEGYVRKEMAYYLQVLFDRVAPKLGLKKFYITSSFRTTDYNTNKVYAGKTPVLNSPHLAGIGVDISVYGNDRYVLADEAWFMGFGGIAVGKNFVHLDIAGRWTWAYPPTPEYKGPGHWYGK